jgi:hypothetical protein
MSDKVVELNAIPKNVVRWILRGGAVPDEVWFGKFSYLKRMNDDGFTWRRSKACEKLEADIRAAGRIALGDA